MMSVIAKATIAVGAFALAAAASTVSLEAVIAALVAFNVAELGLLIEHRGRIAALEGVTP